jgi:hypothetical protein
VPSLLGKTQNQLQLNLVEKVLIIVSLYLRLVL